MIGGHSKTNYLRIKWIWSRIRIAVKSIQALKHECKLLETHVQRHQLMTHHIMLPNNYCHRILLWEALLWSALWSQFDCVAVSNMYLLFLYIYIYITNLSALACLHSWYLPTSQLAHLCIIVHNLSNSLSVSTYSSTVSQGNQLQPAHLCLQPGQPWTAGSPTEPANPAVSENCEMQLRAKPNSSLKQD